MSGTTSKEIRREASQILQPVAEQVQAELAGIRKKAEGFIGLASTEATKAIEEIRAEAVELEKSAETRLKRMDERVRVALARSKEKERERTQVAETAKASSLNSKNDAIACYELVGKSRRQLCYAIAALIVSLTANGLVIWIALR